MDAVVRPARATDRGPLMSFIRHVWGGHDYIPRVWDEWLGDKRNRMYVVEVGGVPVGMNRLRFLEDGSAWFEGVRVHPAYRGRGLASMLGENSMNVAKEKGVGIFRLTSGSRNHIAHKQIAKIRFKEVARFSVYVPRRNRRAGRRAQRVAMDRVRETRELLEGSFEFRRGHGVFWHNWGAAYLGPQVFRALVEEGSVYRHGRALAVYRSGGKGGREWEEVGFVGGDPSDAVALVGSLLGRVERTEERWVFVPQGSPVVHTLRQAGYRRRFSNILFERSSKD